MDFPAFDRQPGALRPSYVIAGETELFRRRALERIAGLATDADRISWEARESSPGRLGEELRTRSFFSKRKLLVVRGVSDWFPRPNAKAADKLDLLAEVVKAHKGPDVLVLECAKWDGRYRGAKAIEKAAEMIDCGPLHERDIPKWLERRVRELGATASPGAVEELVARVGSDLSRADRELEKLSTFASGRPIGVADVKEMVEMDRRHVIWDLLDAIASGDARRALGMLRGHFREGERLVGLIPMLLWNVRRLSQGSRAFRKGGAAEVRSKVRMPWDKVEGFVKLASAWTPGKSRAWLRLLLEADLEAKSGGDEEMTGELLVVRLTRAS
ncbi:MAG: DNA polymerase III subunit delta [Candidatus Brocadiae bacterium]|nr:DNA polymerase III subunit delta [Candidatus Brocadiia bacterium]